MDFIKKHPYIIINGCGLLLVLLCFFVEPIASFGASIVFIAEIVLINNFLALIFTTAFFLVINVSAFYKAESGSSKSIVLSVCGGSLGAFAAVHTVNKKHEKSKIVNVIFNIHLCISAYFAVSVFLYSCGYYNWTWVR